METGTGVGAKIMLLGSWGREALNEVLLFGAVYLISYWYYCYPHFHGIYCFVMWLVLTSVCSNILRFTQKTSVLPPRLLKLVCALVRMYTM